MKLFAFSLNVNTQKEYNNENYFSKSDKPTPDDNSKLLENSEKIMKETAAQMGSLSYAEKEINDLLGF